MDFYRSRLEYGFAGITNYISWKEKMEEVMEDNGLKEFIVQGISKP